MSQLSDRPDPAPDQGGLAWAWAAALTDRANQLVLRPRLVPRLIRARYVARAKRQEQHWIIAVQRGHLSLSSDGRRLDPGPGDVILVPAGTAIDYLHAGERVTQDLHFACANAPTLHACVHRGDWALVDLVDRTVASARSSPGGSLAVRLLLAEVLDRLLADPEPSAGLTAASRQALEAWTDAHLSHAPTPGDLARIAGCGRHAFASRFRASYGMSPRAWIAHRRVRSAEDLMQREGLRLSDVAQRLGYADAAHLGRQLRKVGTLRA
ncbi:hypothetical protein LBMAG53_17140 [Planctomycetota bacterium]|nr:hypothetical protein LBMAG53_17140 [Planctomycetota bacterium]